MSDEVHLVNGLYQLEALGSMTFAARGDGIVLSAMGDDANIVLSGEAATSLASGVAAVSVRDSKGVFLTGGPTGSISQIAGPPGLGARVQLTAEALTLEIGPPQVGASIKLTPTEITLQIGTTKLSLTATGISEAVAAAKREVTPTGHELAAGPTSVQVNVTGVTEKGPMKHETFDAATTSKQALANESTDGIRTIKAGVLMLG